MNSTSLLLKGGIVLQHDAEDNVSALRDTDVLVEGNKITAIGKNLQASDGTRLIDCRNKIVSPGFADTHTHLWKTQLKGRHSDDSLFDYIPKGTYFKVAL